MVAEGFPANVALVRFFSGVNPLMDSKGRAVPKGFVAHITLVRFLSSVNPPVLIKPYVIAERLPTVDTVKELLPCVVVSPVTDEGRVLYEGFSTLHTLIGLLARVTPLMPGEGGAVTEGLSAFATFVGLLSGVNPLVDGEGRALGKSFLTFIAFEKLFSRIDSRLFY